MKYDYDLIVLGSGSAGLNFAVFGNTIKLKVLLVEKHLVGGDCLNFGCVPSKALISLAHSVGTARKTAELGIKVDGRVDMEKVAQIISARQDVIRAHENPEYFQQKGIDVEIGEPRFTSPQAVTVNGKQYSGRRIVIVTGSRPAIPDISGLEDIDYLTNETLFANRTLPGHLLIIGAGPIGIEIAQAYQRLGANVTVIDRSDRILPREEAEASEIITSVLRKEGVRFLLGAQPLQFQKENRLVYRTNDGQEHSLTFDNVLLATGRRSNISGLDLENGGIRVQDNKLVLDKYQRTTNKRVIAAGDAAGSYLFTHWAEYQALVLIRNMLSPFKKTIDNTLIAWVLYTDPELAHFGLSSAELKKNGIVFQTITVPMKDVDRAICEGITDGLLKVYLSKGKLIGGTLVAKNAGDIAGELIGFMTLKLPFSKIYNRIYPYPTMSRISRKAVQKHLGKKLTPRNITILNKLFKWFNR